MGLITSQERKFVSIFIAPTIDLTLEVEPQEKGVIGAIGKLSIGNPHFNQVLTQAVDKLKSTQTNAGGSPDNEFAYHVSEFFNGFNGKIIVSRLMNSASVIKPLAINTVSGVTSITESTPVNIFGANSIVDWAETPAVNPVELIVSACPDDRTTVSVENKNDLIRVVVYDEFGAVIYEVEGGAKFDSTDDLGFPNYIGNIADDRVLLIKVDTTHNNYSPNFSATRTVDAMVSIDISQSGSIDYTSAINGLKDDIEKCDYIITGGLRDIQAVKNLFNIGKEARVPLIYDIFGKTKEDANNYKTQLGFDSPDAWGLWNRAKHVYETGSLNIGLSGWYAGQLVKKNMSRLIANVESRVEGVAGVDYRIPRVLAEPLKSLSNDDKTFLVDNRINTIGMMLDKQVVMDVLSSEPKNVSMRLIPVADANAFIEREIARIMAMKLFKNNNEALQFIRPNVATLFDRAERNNYFNNELDDRYEFDVYIAAIDKIGVKYRYVPSGVMRRGEVRGTLVKKIV